MALDASPASTTGIAEDVNSPLARVDTAVRIAGSHGVLSTNSRSVPPAGQKTNQAARIEADPVSLAR